MHRIQCAEVWGGIRNQEQDACSSGIVASLYSSSCDGGKGGDIYYLSVCRSDLLTRVAIADVKGHGQAVSEVSQFIYDGLQAHMDDASGDDMLKEVNQLAVGRGLEAMTTAAIVAFFQGNSTLYFAYAGHHPALVKRKQDSAWIEATVDEQDDAGSGGYLNPPLAVMPDTSYTQQSLALTAGDRVFLYTDGVIEAPDRKGNLFGSDRLRALLEEHGSAPLPQLKAAVLHELRDYTGGKLAHDDVTLLAIEIRPPE